MLVTRIEFTCCVRKYIPVPQDFLSFLFFIQRGDMICTEHNSIYTLQMQNDVKGTEKGLYKGKRWRAEDLFTSNTSVFTDKTWMLSSKEHFWIECYLLKSLGPHSRWNPPHWWRCSCKRRPRTRWACLRTRWELVESCKSSGSLEAGGHRLHTPAPRDNLWTRGSPLEASWC